MKTAEKFFESILLPETKVTGIISVCNSNVTPSDYFTFRPFRFILQGVIR